MSLEQQRELFEKWITESKPNLKDALVKNSRGNYATRATQLRFEGFVAGLSAKS